MRQFPKPRLVISQCIEFDCCRWNGIIVASDIVKLLKPLVEFLPVCPEMGIGLGVPREPVRVVGTNGKRWLVQPATQQDLTEKMQTFTDSFANELRDVDGFILKSRSPSCGVRDVKIYPPGGHTTPISKGAGMFTRTILERFPLAAVEDEVCLLDINTRHDFLTRIFTFAAFRQAKASGQRRDLVQFQAENKYLLMSYNEQEARELGNIIANGEQQSLDEVAREYQIHLARALAEPPGLKASINVLMHALGYFSDKLSREERAFFLETVQDYRNKRIPMSVCTAILQSWVARFGEEYLQQQTFFEPYPAQLVQVTDPGRGRDI